MSISVNYILEEERKKKQAQTTPVTTPETVQGGVVPPGAIESRTVNYINQLNQQRETPVRDEFDYTNKPETWSEDEYRAIRQVFSDDQIQQALTQPNPENFLNGIYTNLYKKNVPSPIKPDEKSMKRQRAIAGIGDVLGLISQAAAGNMGAINQPRTFEQSAYGQFSKKQQEIYDRYQQETDRYGREIVNAQMKDYLAGIQDWKQTQENISKALADYRKYQIDLAKQQQDAAYKKSQEERQRIKTEADIKNIDSQIKEREQRTAREWARANAYIEKLKKPVKTDTGEKADYQIVVPAAPDDVNAEQDQFGNTVRKFGMSKGELEAYARQALKDTEFMNKHPELYSPNGSYTEANKRDIAAAYIEEIYRQSTGADLDARIGAGNQFSGQIPNIKEEPLTLIKESEIDDIFKVVY